MTTGRINQVTIVKGHGQPGEAESSKPPKKGVEAPARYRSLSPSPNRQSPNRRAHKADTSVVLFQATISVLFDFFQPGSPLEQNSKSALKERILKGLVIKQSAFCFVWNS